MSDLAMHGYFRSIPEQDENRKALKMTMSVGKNKRGPTLCFREGLVPETILRLPYKGKKGLLKDHKLLLPTLSQHVERCLTEASKTTTERERTRTVLLRQQHKGSRACRQTRIVCLHCQHRALPDRRG